MKTDLNDYIVQISKIITKHIKLENIENIVELKSQLKSMLNAEEVRLCRYDSYNNKIESLGDKEIKSTNLDDSFILNSINSQKIEFDNYITSNKNYNTKFDNPTELSIRGLLVYPIIKNSKTIGVLSVFRSSRQRSNFTKQDKEIIKNLNPFITAFFENKNFDKSLLDEFETKPKSNKSKDNVKPKEIEDSTLLNEIKLLKKKLKEEEDKNTSLNKELYDTQKDIDKQKRDKKISIEDLEDKLETKNSELKSSLDKLIKEKKENSILKENTLLFKKLEEDNISLNTKIEDYSIKLKKEIQAKESLESEYQFILENMEVAKKSKLEIEQKYQKVLKDLKSKLDKLEKEKIDYLEQNKILETQYKNYKKIKLEYKSLINDNIEYKEELEEKDTLIKKYKAIEIKNRVKESQKSNKYEVIEHNREFLLSIFMNEFKVYQNAYSMFEMFVYAFSSKNGIDILDNYLSQKELPNLIISEFYRKKTTNLQEKKYQMKKLFNKISSFEKDIFDNKLKLNIIIDENIPMTLIVDISKLESAIYHILLDFSSFMDKEKSINIDFIYIHNNQELRVKIGTFVDENSYSDGLLKNIFTTNNSIKDTESDRLGFIVAKQLLYILGATLKSDERDDYYQNTFSLPAKVLNMSMV